MSNSFNVTSGALVISDPCYGMDTCCQAVIENVQNGTWDTVAEISDEGVWGNRVSKLTAWCRNERPYSMRMVSNEIGVDSGQAGIFDKQFFEDHVNEREYDAPGFYNTCCNLTLSEDMYGVVESSGVVSSSGYGDGSYVATTWLNKEGKVVKVEIDFFGPEEEEDEYFDYDDDDDEY